METRSFLRKITSALVTVAALSPGVMSAYDFEQDGIYYDISGNEATVVRAGENVASYSGDVVIPESVVHDGVEYAVTAIGYSAFSYCYGLTSIEMPNTIVSIGDHAFLHCDALQHVVVPNSVVDMGRCAFHWCTNLRSAVVGNSVRLINDYAFQYCYQLTDVVIGSAVEQLNIKAFYDCGRLANVTCLATVPPTMYAWYSFYDSNYAAVTLHVPGASIEAYKNDENWGMFTKIVSLTKATGLTLDQSLVTLNGGEQLQLKAIVEPADANSTVSWTSTDDNVATVGTDGLVTAQGPGEAIITATTADGTGLTAQCVVRVHSTSVQGDNVLTMPLTVAAEGGQSYDVPVAMRNVAGISALQCDIVLPQGIELAQEDGHYLIDVVDERMSESHAVNVRLLSSGAVRVLITSSAAQPFNGNDGDLLVMHLNVAPEASDGNYVLSLTNVVMADVNALTYHAPDVATTFIIKNKIKGDANGDGMVNVGDYVAIANYILEMNPVPFDPEAADVDGNMEINVADLVGVTNIMMGIEEQPQEPEEPGDVELSGAAVQGTDQCDVTLAMSNEVALTALQMDITVPEGLMLKSARLTSRGAASHAVKIMPLGNGRVRLLASSSMNDVLSGNQGAVLALSLDGQARQGEATIGIDNIVAAEQDMTLHAARAFTVGTDNSAVNEVASGVKIYACDGCVVVETPVDSHVQLIAPNGMTRTVAAKAGTNTYPAQPGICIVRMAGQVAKLRL